MKIGYDVAEMMIRENMNRGVRPRGCGGDGGDAKHYMLPLGGVWGEGQVYISFSNHGYINSVDDLSLHHGYNREGNDKLYQPSIETY